VCRRDCGCRRRSVPRRSRPRAKTRRERAPAGGNASGEGKASAASGVPSGHMCHSAVAPDRTAPGCHRAAPRCRAGRPPAGKSRPRGQGRCWRADDTRGREAGVEDMHRTGAPVASRSRRRPDRDVDRATSPSAAPPALRRYPAGRLMRALPASATKTCGAIDGEAGGGVQSPGGEAATADAGDGNEAVVAFTSRQQQSRSDRPYRVCRRSDSRSVRQPLRVKLRLAMARVPGGVAASQSSRCRAGAPVGGIADIDQVESLGRVRAADGRRAWSRSWRVDHRDVGVEASTNGTSCPTGRCCRSRLRFAGNWSAGASPGARAARPGAIGVIWRLAVEQTDTASTGRRPAHEYLSDESA